MQSTPRFCQLQNHDNNEIIHICTDSKCTDPRRLLCKECHRLKLHNHGSRSQQLVMTLENFRIKYGQSSQAVIIKQRKVDFKCFLKALKQIEQNILECKCQGTQYYNFLKNFQEILDILDQDVNLLTNEQLNNLIKMDNTQFETDFSILRNRLQNIIIQSQKQVEFIDQINNDLIQQQVQRQKEMSISQPDHVIDSQQDMNQIQDYKKIKLISQRQSNVVSDIQNNNQLYDSQIMDQMKKSNIKIKMINQQQEQLTKINNYVEVFYHHQDKIITSSAISLNEQYFSFVQNYRDLKVINLQDNNINFVKRFFNTLSVIKFSEDSKHIFVGDSIGQVTQFRIESCIENILIPSYHYQIHEGSINNIIFLKKQQILTCSDDRSLIISDYQQFKQIMKLENHHSAQIYGLDFDHMKNIIVSSSEDRSISFYNKQVNSNMFRQEQAHFHRITQVNLIQEGTYLLSSDTEQLKLWGINYEMNQIHLINQFNPSFFSYFCVSKEYEIHLIMIRQIIILDLNFIQIQEIQSEFDDFKFIKRVNQPYSKFYLINQSDTHIQVLKKQTLMY